MATQTLNEYQGNFLGGGGGEKNGRCVGLTTLPFLCADCLEILEPEPLGAIGDYLGLYQNNFYLIQIHPVCRSAHTCCLYKRQTVICQCKHRVEAEWVVNATPRPVHLQQSAFYPLQIRLSWPLVRSGEV
jgi:hypothetical protein